MRRLMTLVLGLTLSTQLLFSSAQAAPLAAPPISFIPGDEAIALTAGEQSAPTIAKGQTASLAVWSDGRALAALGGYEGETSRDIYGVRLDAAGNLLDPTPIAITSARATQENPRVAWNGANWLVVFESYMLGGTGYYYEKGLAAVRVAPDGQVLDPRPIPIYGVRATTGMWALASDGNNWVVAFQGSPASNDLMAIRISPSGEVLDPPTHAFVPATYYMRSNLHLAYAGGVFLLTFNDAYVGGTSDTKAVRFDSNLTPLDAAPLALLNVPVSDLAANGNEFYLVWNQQQPDFTQAVSGSRVNSSGQKLDGNGINISQNHPPQGYTATSVVWDGARWKIIWTSNTLAYVAAVNSSGQVVNPGGAALAGVTTGPMAPTSLGGLQIVWTGYNGSNNDIYSANVSATGAVGPSQSLSVGAPMQLRADAATNGAGYLLVYHSSTASENRIMAQPLDATGAPLGMPLQLSAGDTLTGPGAPAVAWNGAYYLVAWGTSSTIMAQRLKPDGSPLDAAPFVVATSSFGSVDVEALGDTFLVVGLRMGYSPEIIFPIGVRVRGSDGAVLDPTPITLGGSYSSRPKTVVLGNRWLVAWQQNASHDNSIASTMGVLVTADGVLGPSLNLYGSYSTAGGNGIFDIGLASNGTVALLVQSAELTSGVETDLLARLINADGTLQPVVNLTPWTGNQYRPRATWDGRQFVTVYQDQRNRQTAYSLEQLDARSDLYGMRLSPTGSVIDPRGFVFSASPLAETHPTVVGGSGVSLLAASLMRNEAPFANYRIGYTLLGRGGNQWPVAVASANPAGGDVPLTVAFSSAGSTDQDGSITSYAWEFGDGTTATDANPIHTYTAGGPYIVTLTLTDNGGATTTQTVFVNAITPNQIPVATASALPTSGAAPLNVVFYSNGSYDPDGFIGNIHWDFGGGWEYWGAVGYHTFDAPGSYPVTLTVYDSQGAIGTATLTVVVGPPNQLPQAVASATPSSGSAPLAVAFSSTGSSDADGTLVSYSWTFGDGGASTQPNPNHTYTAPGTYTTALTVTDNAGGTDTASVTVTVLPGACLNNCLRSTAITFTSRSSVLTGQVTVKTETGLTVKNATVSITWTLPDGSTLAQTAKTSASGVARFSLTAGKGLYRLTVTNITKPNFAFDPLNSVLTKTVQR